MHLRRLSGTTGAALAAALALAGSAPAAIDAPVAGLAQAPGCVPVAGAECGTVSVPLFWADPGGAKIDVAYALLRHTDPAVPAARGTVAVNPGGPGAAAIDRAEGFAQQLAALRTDHDVLLIDPRGVGRSHPIRCGASALPATRDALLRTIARCRTVLGPQARAYTSAATADDFDAVRAALGIPKLDLWGMSYGTYLMTVFAQRHPASVRSIVLSSAYPLKFDMWARANAAAVRRALRLVCARSKTGRCDGDRTLRELGVLARRLRSKPITYKSDGGRRRLDETALAGMASGADVEIGQLPAVVHAAVRGRTGPLLTAARALSPMSGSQAAGQGPDLALAGAILCNDYPTLWDRRASVATRLRQFAARRARLPAGPFRPFSARAWTSAIVDRGDTCIRWPDRAGPVQPTGGPFPDVPVLITSGDLDPNVPTAEGRQAARQFAHARVVDVPNAGHVPEGEGTGCAASISIDFIRNQRLGDTGCLKKIPPVPVR